MQWEQGCLFDDNPEYDAFTEKFKPKKPRFETMQERKEMEAAQE